MGIALIMTVGVYGLVAGIVKLDDAGLYLSQRRRRQPARAPSAAASCAAAPWLMKVLSVAGTAAMFLVGGGILVHGIPPLHHAIERAGGETSAAFGCVSRFLADALIGIAAGRTGAGSR